MLTLTRQPSTNEGTFGTLTDASGNQVAVTCERPDNGNQAMGCIPVGSYQVIKFNSPKMGADFLVQNVPGREMIEIHSGNTISDTEGCILVGSFFGVVNAMRAVLNSRNTLSKMLDAYPDGFTLNIVEE